MKSTCLSLAILLSLARPAPAQTNTASPTDAKPLPSVDFLLQKVVDRAVNQEDKNDDLFNMHYQYTRTRTWEYRNSKGELKSRREKSSFENRPERRAAKAAKAGQLTSPKPPDPPPEKDEPVSETHSNIRGKALKVKDYSIPNLVKRFQLTLVGRELVNGRPSYVVDFKPASDNLPVNSLADKFINKAAGRVWVDEADYAIAQAQLHLTKQVNVLGGLVGAVWKFTYEFTRTRTPEGYWFARDLDWHLEGREVIFNRIVDYHERRLNVQKITAPAPAH
ncbi:MAG TPA: hypothetical protein VMB80_10425 [Candidatus Acidoferrum sp.]|nr:hypothetical protein [Candidatus Acidoferrum sp.]